MDNADLADATVLYPDHIEDPMSATNLDVKLTKDGKVDGRSRAARATRNPSAPRPTNKRPGGRRVTVKKDYEDGINGLGQMAAFALSFKQPADAAAVMLHTPGIAKALNDLAQDKPEVAAVLDRLLSAGPYAALFTAVTPLVLQILTNHNMAPVGILGTVHPDMLVASLSPAGA